MTLDIQEAVLWCLAVALLATAVLLLRQHRIAARLRKRNAILAGDVRTRDEEAHHLATVRLSALEDSMHQPVPATGLLDARLVGTEFAHSLEAVVERFSGAVERAQARADHSAKSALKTSMRSIQALANEQQLSISDMQNRHDDPDVLRDLLEIDHANSQFGRRAQAIAVLCGSWPGRQRAASSLTDVVRGATSRIRDYRRVQINGQVDLAVESRAVEPVVLAVAELLDNAARHSQPNTSVEVNLRSVHNGACIVIDDAGIGMDDQVAQRAASALSGEQDIDVTRLDDPPQFGFPVIGVLAARYGFTVSTDTRSPYGGVRAVLFLPSVLLTQLEPEEPGPKIPRRPSVPSQQPARSAVPSTVTERGHTPYRAGASPSPTAGAAGAAGAGRAETSGEAVSGLDEGAAAETTAGGLPKRRRHSPRRPAGVTGTEPAGVGAPQSASPAAGGRSAQETAQRMGAFARGTRFGRDARDDEGMTTE